MSAHYFSSFSFKDANPNTAVEITSRRTMPILISTLKETFIVRLMSWHHQQPKRAGLG